MDEIVRQYRHRKTFVAHDSDHNGMLVDTFLDPSAPPLVRGWPFDRGYGSISGQSSAQYGAVVEGRGHESTVEGVRERCLGYDTDLLRIGEMHLAARRSVDDPQCAVNGRPPNCLQSMMTMAGSPALIQSLASFQTFVLDVREPEE